MAAPPVHLVPGKPIRMNDLIAKTESLLSKGTKRTYGPHFRIIETGHVDDAGTAYPGVGGRWAHEVTHSELQVLIRVITDRAESNNNQRNDRREAAGRVVHESDGAATAYSARGAMRKLFSVAVLDRHLAKAYDPTTELAVPTRQSGNRRPLTPTQLEQFWSVVINGGDDPELDAMLCQSAIILGARRAGLLALRLGDVDRELCMVKLREKGREGRPKVTGQPCPDWFAEQLEAFARSRGSYMRTDPVFRGKWDKDGLAGRATTGRRFDTLFERVKVRCRWADKNLLCLHTLRHHAHAVVERHAGTAVAEEFVRHEPDKMSRVYGRATPAEVALAVVEIFGGSHPLVDEAGPDD